MGGKGPNIARAVAGSGGDLASVGRWFGKGGRWAAADGPPVWDELCVCVCHCMWRLDVCAAGAMVEPLRRDEPLLLCGRRERNDTRRGSPRAHPRQRSSAADADRPAASTRPGRHPHPHPIRPQEASTWLARPRAARNEQQWQRNDSQTFDELRRRSLGGPRCTGWEGSGAGRPRRRTSGSTIGWPQAQIIRSLTVPSFCAARPNRSFAWLACQGARRSPPSHEVAGPAIAGIPEALRG